MVSVGTRTARDASSAPAQAVGCADERARMFEATVTFVPLQGLSKLRTCPANLLKEKLCARSLSSWRSSPRCSVSPLSPWPRRQHVHGQGQHRQRGLEVQAQAGCRQLRLLDRDRRDGTLSNPVKTYKIHFAGLKFSPKSVAGGKYCSAASINAGELRFQVLVQGTKVGTGEVNAIVGSAGQPVDPNLVCNLALDIYAGSAEAASRCTCTVIRRHPAVHHDDQPGDRREADDGLQGQRADLHGPAECSCTRSRVWTRASPASPRRSRSRLRQKALFYSEGCKGTRKVKVDVHGRERREGHGGGQRGQVLIT